MGYLLRYLVAIACIAVLGACGGGGDSSSTTLRCGTVNCVLLDPPVATTDFVQSVNNMRVVVDDLGPRGFDLTPSTNMLFATVTVCALGGVPGDTSQCATIDHVLVDTGSVGLRVLASKVSNLSLPAIPYGASRHTWECYPFVIGGLWGKTAAADVWLGKQTATAVAIQLIDDKSEVEPPSDCVNINEDNLLKTASLLRANGILGIGDTVLDCGIYCANGAYSKTRTGGTGSTTLYYDNCPTSKDDTSVCSLAATPEANQIFNPVAALPAPYNNGVVLKMPSIPNNLNGAATASGELILGLDGNNLPTGAKQIFLGVADPASDTYLRIHTKFNNNTFVNSYLDTGTNALFFYDSTIAACKDPKVSLSTLPSYWYCPADPMRNLQALLWDGDAVGDPATNTSVQPVAVNFQVTNAAVTSNTSNAAISGLAGALNKSKPDPLYPNDPTKLIWEPEPTSFVWGMPFFYGKQVYMSIWQQPGSENGPWYAWVPL